jgi:hypothetical protein
MRQNPSLDGPLKTTRRLLGMCGGPSGSRATPLRGIKSHMAASDSPAISFNLRLSEILPGSSEDLISWGGSPIDA